MSDTPNKGGRPKKNHWNSDRLSEMELDEIFAEIPNEYSVKVHRKEPEWAAGYLGVINFSSDDPFSLEELQARFGGSLFVLKIVDEQHKYKGQKTVRIADVPRKDYEEMNPDYLTRDGAQRRASMRNGNGQFAKKNNGGGGGGGGMFGFDMPANLPADMQRKILKMYIFGDEAEKKEKGSTTAEIMQQKLVMDMMQAQSTHQMAMQKHQLEYERELEKMRRGREPDEPLGDVKTTIELLRELNGMKTEFGGSEHVATEIIGTTAPIIETALTELLALQKLKIQGELAKVKAQTPPRPPLPPRQQPQTVQRNTPVGHNMSTPQSPLNGTGQKPKKDVLELAREMGETFRGLDDEQQQACLNAFMGQNLEHYEKEVDVDVEKGNNNSDTVTQNEVLTSNADLLDPDDKAVLESSQDADDRVTEQDDNDETGDVSDCDDTGAIEAHDPPDRESDQGGIPVSTD